MSEIPESIKEATYMICIVALDRKVLPKRVYKNFYLGVRGSRESAIVMQNTISRVGFKAEGERIFPDDIESINLKKRNDVNDETGEKETD